MSDHQQQVRRRSDGTIDLDFYREQALTERAEAMTAFFRSMTKTTRPAIAFTLIVGMIAVAALLHELKNSGGMTTVMAALGLVQQAR